MSGSRQLKGGSRQATIETAYALYDKTADRFELKNGVHMVTGNDPPADIRTANAVYEQASGNVHLAGNAELTKGTSYVRGDNVDASLNAAEKPTGTPTVRGSGYLKSTLAGTSHRAGLVGRPYGRRFRRRSANTKGQRDGKHKGRCHAYR